MRPYANSVWGLKLLVYEALRDNGAAARVLVRRELEEATALVKQLPCTLALLVRLFYYLLVLKVLALSAGPRTARTRRSHCATGK